jgi:hypothetical protein
MKMILEDSDLMAVADGSLARPSATADPTGHAEWISKDRKARIQIATTLRKGPLNLILEAKTAKECWDRIVARYQGRGGRRIAYLMESFFRVNLTDTEPLEPQLNRLVEAGRNLESINCGVNDKALAYIIIMALPDTLSTLQTILFNKDEATITSEEVIAQILADEERRIHTSGATATAYFAKLGGKRPNNKGRGNGKKRCSYCKGRNHEVSVCKKKKKDEADKAKSNSSNTSDSSTPPATSSAAKANIAVTEDDVIRLFEDSPATKNTTDITCAFVSRSGQLDMSDTWLLDSGASRIMSSHREWFHHLGPLPKPINGYPG